MAILKLFSIALLWFFALLIWTIAEVLRLQHRRWDVMGSTLNCIGAYFTLVGVAIGFIILGGYVWLH